MEVMATAKAGIIPGKRWEGIVLPERHQDVMRAAYIRRGVNLKAPRETGEVNDAPSVLNKNEIAREIRRHKKDGNGHPLRVLVLFAGGGGATEGYRQVDGAVVVAAVEFNGEAAMVYAGNHSHPVLQLDIADWKGVAASLQQFGPFDLVQWSPPCQPHSRANANKIEHDPREAVMLSAAKLIHALDAPHFIMENVCSVAKSPVWLEAKSFLFDRGYRTLELEVNANHCGVPQKRIRLFAIGSKTASPEMFDAVEAMALDIACAGPDTPSRNDEFGGCRRPVVIDIITHAGISYWLRDRGDGPCVRSTSDPAPTVLTTCTGKPRRAKRRRGGKGRKRRRYTHVQCENEAGDVDLATIFSVPQVGQLQGFPFTYRWNAVSRTTAGRLIGNAVPPKMMRTVGRWIVRAGLKPKQDDTLLLRPPEKIPYNP